MNGDFGMSPFRGQQSGKPLPAINYACVVPGAKHKGARKTFAVEVADDAVDAMMTVRLSAGDVPVDQARCARAASWRRIWATGPRQLRLIPSWQVERQSSKYSPTGRVYACTSSGFFNPTTLAILETAFDEAWATLNDNSDKIQANSRDACSVLRWRESVIPGVSVSGRLRASTRRSRGGKQIAHT